MKVKIKYPEKSNVSSGKVFIATNKYPKITIPKKIIIGIIIRNLFPFERCKL